MVSESYDCTAHLLPYLKVLHDWLLKVGAEMPATMKATELTAPIDKRIDHLMLAKNEDHNELLYLTSPHCSLDFLSCGRETIFPWFRASITVRRGRIVR